MRTTNNLKLLIDVDCPMCQMYGNVLEKSGTVAQGTCSPYQLIDVSFAKVIDMAKARNEIALIDTQSNTVRYGVDAFAYILTAKYPVLKHAFDWKPFDFILRKLYKFISYNRKVIAPAIPKITDRTCIPDVNFTYRWLYVAFIVLFSSIVLFNFTQPINSLLGVKSHLGREFLVCLGQILWQTIFLRKMLKEKILDYLGNMMTVSLIGTLLLLPPFLLKNFVQLSPIFYLIYFGIVVIFMLIEHLRRCKISQIGYLPSISWVTYRTFVVVLIGFLK